MYVSARTGAYAIIALGRGSRDGQSAKDRLSTYDVGIVSLIYCHPTHSVARTE